MYILKLTTNPQTIAFVHGIGRDYVEIFEFLLEIGETMYLNTKPMKVANNCGNMVKMMASSNRLV